MEKNIEEKLYVLGLDKDEAEVFVYLAKSDEPFTILELSEKKSIPRTTMYRICNRLSKKNLAEWVVGDRGKEIRAVDSESLDLIVKTKRREFKDTKESVEVIKRLISQEKSKVPKTQVRYYSGKEGLKQILWNCLKAEDEIVGYSQFGRAKIVGEAFYNRYVVEFKLRKLRDRVIANENSLEYIENYVKKKAHQLGDDDARIIPKDNYYVTGDTSIYNNTYAVCYWDQGEIVGVEIENAELVKLQKSIFEMLWKIGNPVSEFL